MFWFTSKFVGTGEAGRFLSQTVAGFAYLAHTVLKGGQQAMKKPGGNSSG